MPAEARADDPPESVEPHKARANEIAVSAVGLAAGIADFGVGVFTAVIASKSEEEATTLRAGVPTGRGYCAAADARLGFPDPTCAEIDQYLKYRDAAIAGSVVSFATASFIIPFLSHRIWQLRQPAEEARAEQPTLAPSVAPTIGGRGVTLGLTGSF